MKTVKVQKDFNLSNVQSLNIFGDLSLVVPFSSRLVNVPPGESTNPHNHHDVEMWIILNGKGLLHSNGKDYFVNEGEIVYFDPLDSHVITNQSTNELLQFLTIWWEDMEFFNEEILNKVKSVLTTENAARKEFILPSFPTPNGSLHIGHLSGPYIGADAYSRHLKMTGVYAKQLLGTVGYQSHVLYKAQSQGKTFYETAEENTEDIIETLKAVGISPDIFIRPTTSKYYLEISQQIFTNLYDKGYIKVKEKLSWFCNHCNNYLFEAFVSGECLYCGDENAAGNECEGCGRLYEDATLQKARCKCCGHTPVLKNLKRPYFELNQFKNELSKYYETVNFSPKLRRFCEEIMSEDLPDVPTTYITDFGIPVPIEGFSNQRIFSAFELVGRFLAAARELIENDLLENDWVGILENKDFCLSMFFGFDNSYLRAVIFPAILSAYNSNINLPKNLMTNEFYNLDNLKFSTSRNHVIWGKDLVKETSSDVIRFYLCYTRPENYCTNFNIDDFHKTTTEILVNKWGTVIDEIGTHATQLFQNKSPEPGSWDLSAQNFYSEITHYHQECQRFFKPEFFSLQRVVRTLDNFVDSIEQFLMKIRPVILKKQTCNSSLLRTYVALELMALQSLAKIAWPIMPNFSEKIWRDLGYVEEILQKQLTIEVEWVPTINKVEICTNNYFNSQKSEVLSTQ